MSLSTTDVGLTTHLVMTAGHPGDGFPMGTAQGLQERFGVGHTTLQVEAGTGFAYAVAPDHID